MAIFNIFMVKISLDGNYNKFRLAVFGSELILGSYLSRFFPILFGLFIYIDQKTNLKLLLIVTLIFILSEGLIFLGGERLALFFMNLSAIFIILTIKNYGNMILDICLVMLNIFIKCISAI